jgi:hypothetical protein
LFFVQLIKRKKIKSDFNVNLFIPFLNIDYLYEKSQWIFELFSKILGKMAHNVLDVCDVLTARIEKCVAFLGLAKCGWSELWEGAQRLT